MFLGSSWVNKELLPHQKSKSNKVYRDLRSRMMVKTRGFLSVFQPAKNESLGET